MPLSRRRRNIIQNFLKEKQIDSTTWTCCDHIFQHIRDIGKHVDQCHENDILEREEQYALEEEARRSTTAEYSVQELKSRRGTKGSSDAITLECNCDTNAFKVILFYKYVHINDPAQFALDHKKYCADLTGKVRIASEGINATLAGHNKDIDRYLDWLTHTQPFDDDTSKELKEPIPLTLSDTMTPRYKFFKPSAGCLHVFSELSIKLVEEICPLGEPSVTLHRLKSDHHQQGKLSPEHFHNVLLDKRHHENYLLLDTRNYYESRIGYFEGAIQPPIRKFSQFPEFVERNKEKLKNKTILTYCTGGIRCEKASAFLRQALPDEEILMLDGGIHNYLEWWKEKTSTQNTQLNDEEALWKGKNYVFDARQSIGADKIDTIVGQCQFCSTAWDKYAKCASPGCHLLVLCCEQCQQKMPNQKVYCCSDCQTKTSKGLCACERIRKENEMKTL